MWRHPIKLVQGGAEPFSPFFPVALLMAACQSVNTKLCFAIDLFLFSLTPAFVRVAAFFCENRWNVDVRCSAAVVVVVVVSESVDCETGGSWRSCGKCDRRSTSSSSFGSRRASSRSPGPVPGSQLSLHHLRVPAAVRLAGRRSPVFIFVCTSHATARLHRITASHG